MNTPALHNIATTPGNQYAWLRQSLNVQEMALILFGAKKWDGACYHTQQACEKALKFVLSSAGVAFRHTHSVHELAKDCNKTLTQKLFDDELIDHFKELSQYTTIARYPSSSSAPVDLITERQALTAMHTVNETLLILEKLYATQ
ncbi:HEPN domain-containing protein [Methylomonas rivi]|uniref:HEPN domain-containing protein n=1 Tax=Methylomonas rivi TaxID=2952226 RepID=A0ABT1U0C0_9GAMM|nr:HEPN domain-containing protein [Methylomonas sp. WSC-6]MCQ8127273.1 HEPN domain-containing protein [Methylomonas sp. WSC-6]